MPTKSISTIQSGQVLDATHYLQISTVPAVIFDIEGEVSSTTGTSYFIQLHGASPTAGMKPLYSRLAVPSSYSTGINGFSFVYRPDGLDTSTMNNPYGGTTATDGSNTLPVWIAISSTDATYTSVAASTNVTVDFEETQLELQNPTVTGDTTTGVNSLTVFTTNAGKRLTQFTATNNTGATAYLMLFAKASPAAGSVPIAQWTFTNGQTINQNFGRGLAPMQQSGTDFTNYTGCYLVGSSTSTTLTASTGNGWTIKAWNI
jgi:hypothetical protein